MPSHVSTDPDWGSEQEDPSSPFEQDEPELGHEEVASESVQLLSPAREVVEVSDFETELGDEESLPWWADQSVPPGLDDARHELETMRTRVRALQAPFGFEYRHGFG